MPKQPKPKNTLSILEGQNLTCDMCGIQTQFENAVIQETQVQCIQCAQELFEYNASQYVATELAKKSNSTILHEGHYLNKHAEAEMVFVEKTKAFQVFARLCELKAEPVMSEFGDAYRISLPNTKASVLKDLISTLGGEPFTNG